MQPRGQLHDGATITYLTSIWDGYRQPMRGWAGILALARLM